jgi:hypothetical protein
MRRILNYFAFLTLLFSADALAWGGACTPSFPLEHGQQLSWQGADDAYSVPLPDGRDVWIFGDTLYGPERFVQGNDPRMTHSSIGISTCDGKGQWHLKYFFKRDKKGQAASFFVPKDPVHWYWAMDGFVSNGNLWITLLCIKPASHPEPWAMNFETCGTDLARISNPGQNPDRWNISYFPLVKDGVKAYPSASAVVLNGYVYIFALYESASRSLLATRIPLGGLGDPQAHLEYLAADGTWPPGFSPEHAKVIMQKGTTELSIRYHPDLKQWIAVLIDPNFFSEKMLLRNAPDLMGPWTEGQVIYRIPEMLPGPQRDKDTFCYAGKEHPELESHGELLFTYVCNTMAVPKLTSEPNIYFPQVVSVPMPDLTRP